MGEVIWDASLYGYYLYITIDWSICLSQGRGNLYTVIRSFMKALGFNMYIIHLGILGMVHNLQWIAAIA